MHLEGGGGGGGHSINWKGGVGVFELDKLLISLPICRTLFILLSDNLFLSTKLDLNN